MGKDLFGMARFVLIDHSVTTPGGHNFEHATDTLEAAEKLGYEPVLAANQAVAAHNDWPDAWQVLPVFAEGWDPLHWIGPDGRSHHPADIEGHLLPANPASPRTRGLLARFGHWRTRLRDHTRTRQRRARITRFAHACSQLWKTLQPTSHDRFFLPSVTEFDLLGLIHFLKGEPGSELVDWHLLFHFNLFLDRTPTYAAQHVTRDRFRRLFTAALAHVPAHRLHFYGVTDLVADQYNRLHTTAHFSELPYTINGAIRAADAPATRPLRLTCPGVIRREKGKRQIRSLVRLLWHDHLRSGAAQLIFQGQPKALSRFFPRETLAHSRFCAAPDERTGAPIVVVRHPLDAASYAQLIRESHIGLFLHDSARYYSRCSGTLVELLGAGVPVIVPAGCWLAEQIATPTYEYLDKLVESDVALGQLSGGAVNWSVSPAAVREPGAAELPFGAGRQRASCQVELPEDSANIVLSLELAEQLHGHYVRVTADQLDSRGQVAVARQEAILGARRGGGFASAMFTLSQDACTLRLALSNAYGRELLHAARVRLTFLGGDQQQTCGYPSGSVGLIAADLAEYSRLLSDMTTHYEHYRASAVAFADSWLEEHSATSVIRRIEAVSRRSGDRVAAA
jgi:hypothetical protein